MDAIRFLKNQHRLVDSLFKQFEATEDESEKRALFFQIADNLAVHATIEERFFYPVLLKVGKGAAKLPGATSDDDDTDDEVEDAIKDHNEIRDAVRATSAHEVGSEEWWRAIREAREANDDHMGEEERDDLPDFRRNADFRTRHDIAVRFLQFEGEHATGITPVDKDPEEYVKNPEEVIAEDS